jgi:hypothetical protein
MLQAFQPVGLGGRCSPCTTAWKSSPPLLLLRRGDLRLQRRLHVPRLDTDYRQACFRNSTEEPFDSGPASNPFRLKL